MFLPPHLKLGYVLEGLAELPNIVNIQAGSHQGYWMKQREFDYQPPLTGAPLQSLPSEETE